MKYLLAISSILMFAFNASAENEAIDLNETTVDNYSPYSYQGQCSYLNDPGCSGRILNPATNSTTYVGVRSTGWNDDYRYGRNRHGNGNHWDKFRSRGGDRNGDRKGDLQSRNERRKHRNR